MSESLVPNNKSMAQREVIRNNILTLQNILLAQPGVITAKESERDSITTYFAPGTYARKIFIAKGMCVVGKIHKHAHLNILLYGKCKIVTEFGEDTLKGPRIWISEPGTKRAVFATTDLEWVTVHHNPTNITDLAALEEQIIAQDYETFDRLQLESGDIT